MRVLVMLMRILMICEICVSIIWSVCPNSCSGHGSCSNSVCVCFSDSESGESYSGADCSLRGCARGNPFSAVLSVYPSLGVGSSYYSVNRELSEVREMEVAESGGYSLKLVEGSVALDSEGRLWKVSGIEKLVEIFPKSGGMIECNFTGKSSSSVQQSIVNVISYTSTSTYVLFDETVTSIGESGEYKSVICTDILSMRNDLTQINPTIVEQKTTPAAGSDPVANSTSTITWNGYGEILTDMGLLTPNKETPTKYENNEFVFACYTPPITGSITDVELKTYRDVKAVREDSTPNDVKFTISNAAADKVPEENDVCLCLMDGEGKAIELEESEISENIRYDESDKKYKIGKYTKAEKHVAFGSLSTVADKTITSVTIIADNADDLLYFSENRVVYGTILDGGIFKEITVKMESADKATPVETPSSGLLLPYLRSSAINPLTPSPTPAIVKSGSFYNAYYFADNLLNSMKKEGGVLECEYTPTAAPRERILADVKGIVRDSKNVIIYSYLEIADGVNKDTLKCSGIKSIRNDMTTYNGLSELVMQKTSGGGSGRLLTENIITWTGYSPILKNMGYAENNEVNFTCFRTDDPSKLIKTIETTLSYDKTTPTNALFTYTPTSETVARTYICFMKTKFDKTDVILENSDIKDKIVYDNSSPNKNYYFGEYIVSTETKYEKETDGTEVIILNSGSKFELKNDNSASTITIPDFEKIPEDIQTKLVTGNTFKLKVMKKESFIETTVKCTISSITTPTPAADPAGSRRSLESVKKIISFSPTDSNIKFDTDDIPFYVMYLNIPTPPPTSEPTEKPTETPITEINNIDVNSYFYEISNFLEDITSQLPLIGGKLQCKIDSDGHVGIIDVKGVKEGKSYYKFDKALIVGRRILSENEILLENIKDCRITNVRKDMSFYNVLKLDNSNYVNGIMSWIGYGEIFPSLNGNMICYNPSKESNKEMTIYENLKIYRIKNLNNDKYDIKIQFGDKKPSVDDVCYMLSNGNTAISIESSELNDFIRKDSNGNYYFGKSEIKEDGKSEEIKKSDGSVEISVNSNKFVDSFSSDDENDRFDDKNKNQLDLFDIKEPSSPSLYIPPDMIGIESQKMVVVGNTVELIFISKGEKFVDSAQILKINKDKLERFQLLLSSAIYLPTKPDRRLRSLAPADSIDTDMLVTINFKSEGSTHVSLECSGQGSCDRSSGICKCYNGFSGSACERLDCPNNCNGNGRCVALSELLSNEELEEYIGFGNKHVGKYDDGKGNSGSNPQNVEFPNQVFGCLCDKRHRGYDCSLIECPSDKDPEEATNTVGNEYRDCSGRGICNYSTGVCECFDGFSGEGCQNQVEMM